MHGDVVMNSNAKKPEKSILAEKISRRKALSTAAKVAVGVVVAGVVAGVGGYYAGSTLAPPTTVTKTETVTAAATTIEKTVEKTVTVAAPATTITKTVTVGAPVKKPFEGVKLTVCSIDWLLCPLMKKHKKDWEELTGGTIELVPIPYDALYEKVMTDFVTRTGAYDVIVFPGGWIGDLAGGGWLEDLTPYMEKYGYPLKADILPACRKVAEWAGKPYSLPYDGDCHLLYYRKDVMTNPAYREEFRKKFGYEMPIPPTTWEQVLDVAKFFNGWDWDGDGEIEYGIAFIAKRGTQAVWTLLDLVAQYNVIHGPLTNYTGNMFFDLETMEPLIGEPGAIEALKMLCELAKYAPPGLLGYGYSEFREAYVKGGVAVIGIDWGDVGIMEWMDPASVVRGKLGYAKLPGAMKVWDRKNKKWLEQYNQNNFADFGGWCIGISVLSKNKEAAYDLVKYLTSPEVSLLDACGVLGCWGNNPYRYSHFDVDEWVKVGFSRESAEQYLGVIKDILSDPYCIPDLKIPGREEYYDKLDAHLAEALAGITTPEEAMKAAKEDWEKITDKLGRNRQLKLYRESLGVV